MGQDGVQDMAQVGRVLLPSTHKGGPRYMQQLLQDSLAICCEYRKPDLFLTMAANGSWPEITQNLLPGLFVSYYVWPPSDHHAYIGQTAVVRPELVTRVFHGK